MVYLLKDRIDRVVATIDEFNEFVNLKKNLSNICSCYKPNKQINLLKKIEIKYISKPLDNILTVIRL